MTGGLFRLFLRVVGDFSKRIGHSILVSNVNRTFADSTLKFSAGSMLMAVFNENESVATRCRNFATLFGFFTAAALVDIIATVNTGGSHGFGILEIVIKRFEYDRICFPAATALVEFIAIFSAGSSLGSDKLAEIVIQCRNFVSLLGFPAAGAHVDIIASFRAGGFYGADTNEIVTTCCEFGRLDIIAAGAL